MKRNLVIVGAFLVAAWFLLRKPKAAIPGKQPLYGSPFSDVNNASRTSGAAQAAIKAGATTGSSNNAGSIVGAIANAVAKLAENRKGGASKGLAAGGINATDQNPSDTRPKVNTSRDPDNPESGGQGTDQGLPYGETDQGQAYSINDLDPTYDWGVFESPQDFSNDGFTDVPIDSGASDYSFSDTGLSDYAGLDTGGSFGGSSGGDFGGYGDFAGDFGASGSGSGDYPIYDEL